MSEPKKSAILERQREQYRIILRNKNNRVRKLLARVKDPGDTLNGVLPDWFIAEVETLLWERDARYGL